MDVVAIGVLPEHLQERPEPLAACLTGATAVDELADILGELGYEHVQVQVQPALRRTPAGNVLRTSAGPPANRPRSRSRPTGRA